MSFSKSLNARDIVIPFQFAMNVSDLSDEVKIFFPSNSIV